MRRLLIAVLAVLLPTSALAQFKQPGQKAQTNRTNAVYVSITNPTSPLNVSCQAQKETTVYALSVASSMTVNFNGGSSCQPNQFVEIEYKQTAGGVAITYTGTSVLWLAACTPSSCVQPTLSGNTKIDSFRFRYDALSGQMIEIGQALNVPPAAFAAGANGAIQYASGGNLAGAVISGPAVIVGNGSSAPTALAGNTLASHNFANSISAAGVISGARPATADLSDVPYTGGLVSNTTVNPSAYLLSTFSPNGRPRVRAGTGLTTVGPKVSIANTAVTPGTYTNTNLTVNAQGQLTAASSGSASAGVGFINSPTVTAGAATLVAQCTTAGCTDDNRVANGSNSGALTLTTPASGGMTDGEMIKVTVTDSGTAPSSIGFTAGGGVTFKSTVTGDSDGAPGSAAGCGTPPATGVMVYWWWWHSPNLRLIFCAPDPPAATVPASLGGLFGNTFGLGFDFMGTPGGGNCSVAGTAGCVEATSLAFNINVPTNYATPTSTCKCLNGNPAETDAYTIKCNGVSKGTFSLSTSCVLTLPTQAAYQCTAGQVMEIDAPATVSGKDVLCTVAYTR